MLLLRTFSGTSQRKELPSELTRSVLRKKHRAKTKTSRQNQKIEDLPQHLKKATTTVSWASLITIALVPTAAVKAFASGAGGGRDGCTGSASASSAQSISRDVRCSANAVLTKRCSSGARRRSTLQREVEMETMQRGWETIFF